MVVPILKSGSRPNKIDARDYDFHKTFGNVGVIKYPVFDPEYLCDAGLTMFNQNVANLYFDPTVPAEPYGCTNYCQGDCSTDTDGQVKNPAALEAVTHANALGGFDVRQSFLAAVKIGWFSAFFNITAYAPLDFFDAFRVAQISGAPERRSISWGCPWFPSWEAACNPNVNPLAIMPMPTDLEITTARKETGIFGGFHRLNHKLIRLAGGSAPAIGWHNSKLDGWTNVQGRLVYRDKSFQGNTVGNNGFIYFPREVINMVMTISGTVAFTGTKMGITAPQTIPVSVIQQVASWIRNLFGYNRY